MFKKDNPVREQIKRVAIRIKTEDRWTQGTLARDFVNNPTNILSPLAVKFCMMGAIHLECTAPAVSVIARAVEEASGSPRISVFNDDHKTTHKDVMRVLRRALLEADRKARKWPPLTK